MAELEREKEEYLEILWEMKEQGRTNIEELSERINGEFETRMVDELVIDGLVDCDEKDRNICLTQDGIERARQIIRGHRIGERLLYDVFGNDFETGACEFEHTSTIELVDGICTLLGHPRECPHGMPIPEGDCCRNSVKTVGKAVKPLTETQVGESVRVAYINSRDDRQLHKLDGLQIKPGNVIKLHQRYPCYVIECEGSNIAMDEEIVSSIQVWSNSTQTQTRIEKPGNQTKKRSGWWTKSL